MGTTTGCNSSSSAAKSIEQGSEDRVHSDIQAHKTQSALKEEIITDLTPSELEQYKEVARVIGLEEFKTVLNAQRQKDFTNLSKDTPETSTVKGSGISSPNIISTKRPVKPSRVF